ncbi:hypothetical protein [Kamptonema sp. PCC 6506]|nr:hypothetical protein [Kamptonema sp. PCC 6506]CBN58133.1 hypothetical protein OSCI_3640003 [Kamptonema sp. PCC 6506]
MKPEPNSQLIVINSKKTQAAQPKLNSVLYPDEFYKQQDKTEIEQTSIWDVFRRRAILIVGVTAALTTAAFSWTLTQTNEYEGKFQL